MTQQPQQTTGLPDDLTFKGKGYNAKFDKERLSKTMRKVFEFMSDGQRHTLREITKAAGENKSEASVSAMIRSFRIPENGGFCVLSESIGNGVWHYWLDFSQPSNLGAPSFKRARPGVQPANTGPAVVLDAQAKAARDLAQYLYDETRKQINEKKGFMKINLTPIEVGFIERMATAAGLVKR